MERHTHTRVRHVYARQLLAGSPMRAPENDMVEWGISIRFLLCSMFTLQAVSSRAAANLHGVRKRMYGQPVDSWLQMGVVETLRRHGFVISLISQLHESLLMKMNEKIAGQSWKVEVG